jgi:hypothetical protein
MRLAKTKDKGNMAQTNVQNSNASPTFISKDLMLKLLPSHSHLSQRVAPTSLVTQAELPPSLLCLSPLTSQS